MKNKLTEKKCRLCEEVKPVTEFYYRKDSKSYRSECYECTITKQRLRNTGASAEDYEKFYVKQKGMCKICGVKMGRTRYNRLAVDHCHKSGKLRGLLCSNCNTAIGLMKDSTIRLEKAIEYLKSCEDIV